MSKSLNDLLAAGFDDDQGAQPEVIFIPDTNELEVADKLTQPEDASRKSYHIPPKLIEDVQQDPEKIRPVARSMLAVNLHNLFKRIQHPATTTSDRLAFQAMLNKMGGLEAKEAVITPGAGFSITINIPTVGETKGRIIEATAVEEVVKPDELSAKNEDKSS